jgi:hypothetical protein
MTVGSCSGRPGGRAYDATDEHGERRYSLAGIAETSGVFRVTHDCCLDRTQWPDRS